MDLNPRLSSSVGSIPRKKPGKLDGIRSDDCLDAMKSSSPHEMKVIKDHGVEVISSENDFDYQSWMVWFMSPFFHLFEFVVLLNIFINRSSGQ